MPSAPLTASNTPASNVPTYPGPEGTSVARLAMAVVNSAADGIIAPASGAPKARATIQYIDASNPQATTQRPKTEPQQSLAQCSADEEDDQTGDSRGKDHGGHQGDVLQLGIEPDHRRRPADEEGHGDAIEEALDGDGGQRRRLADAVAPLQNPGAYQ